MRPLFMALAVSLLGSAAIAQEQPTPQEQIQAMQQMLQQASAEKFQLLVALNHLKAETEKLRADAAKPKK